MSRRRRPEPGTDGRTARRATIREVARLAGVSIGTVSHVINGHRRVGPASRAAVEQAIATLGFTPDLIARSLIARRGRAGAPERDPAAPRLTTVGYVSADYTARVVVLPHRDDRLTAQTIEKTLGGPAANVAVMAAGLGPPFAVACDLLTVLGDDADSDWALALLASRGVEAISSSEPGRRLARCVIMVEANGARTIVYEPIAVPEALVLRYLQGLERTAAPHCLQVQGYHAPDLEQAAALARALGLVTSVHTTGLPPVWRTPAAFAELRRRFDLVFLNREVARALTGYQGAVPDLIRRLGELVAATRPARPGTLVVLTLDEAGAVLFEGPQAPVHAPAPMVEPVDTTGAGDCFVGVFLASWLNAVAPRDALRLAVAAASRSVTVAGAQELRLDGATLLGGSAVPAPDPFAVSQQG